MTLDEILREHVRNLEIAQGNKTATWWAIEILRAELEQRERALINE